MVCQQIEEMVSFIPEQACMDKLVNLCNKMQHGGHQ
jgi:hypothetical protein